MRIFYIHGLLSSGRSGTPSRLRHCLPDDEILSPDIPFKIDEALAFIRAFADEERPDLIIASNFGAMLATQLIGYQKIFINPMLEISKKILHLHGFRHFEAQRDDERQSCFVSLRDYFQYKKFEKHLYDKVPDNERDNTFAVFGDYPGSSHRRAVYIRKYYFFVNVHGGRHLKHDDINKCIVPKVEEIRAMLR